MFTSPLVRTSLAAAYFLTASVAQRLPPTPAIDSTVMAAVRKQVAVTMDQYKIPAVS